MLRLMCVSRLFRDSLSEDRVGDICNACVLLVKRWKKLPHGSKKNWNHVSHEFFLIAIDIWLSDVCLFFNLTTWCFFKRIVCIFPDSTQVVDARAGPGFKVTKPKKIKNGDGKKKSKLKKLHKLRRQSKS